MSDYGEVLYIKWQDIEYKFRIGPVPRTGKNTWRFYNWYKNPAVRKRERSLYWDYKKFVRPKRSPNYMVDPWDDLQRGDTGTRKSWKNKKIKRQWMKKI